jgi:uncharacterized tellurite resistance protein B-like protein
MSFIARLRDVFGPFLDPDLPENDERLTVAALLTMVARVDGRLLEVERGGLRDLFGSRLGLAGHQVEHLLERMEEISGTMDPSTTLVARILQAVPYDERPRLLSQAYRIAAIDGKVHEFEDGLIWRTGRLLDLSEEELSAIKADALSDPRPDEVHG